MGVKWPEILHPLLSYVAIQALRRVYMPFLAIQALCRLCMTMLTPVLASAPRAKYSFRAAGVRRNFY
eukprot:NODE_2934_length_436_cov_4.271318_g2436_i0.p1 GENE.NODE_2934_length_436_cov_4.271318_g2436_i0~~NODE_2934_length_436_cov_4.271318_g2436_i0.p1  ORF type:complete len:67 (+),score=0.32 NODE_2934_length_436_cov_4.271318_g2436_i0:146-346(+)